MEIRENSQKRVLLSVLGVAILVVAVIGISFAAYTGNKATNDNTITTGTLMVGYSEDSTAINIENALPMSDEEAMKSSNLSDDSDSFIFTVSTKANEPVSIPYTITLTPDNTGVTNVLPADQVKVWLTAGDRTVVGPTLVSALTDGTGDRAGSKVLAEETAVGNGTVNTVSYTLKMWVADTYDAGSSDSYSYSAKVNVDSTVAAIQ